MSIHVFGIRHHGPGCARSLRAALEALAPDAVMLEGPADAEAALPAVAAPQMRPPVALVVYPPDEPAQAVYFPFAVFSPEWQTLRWAAERSVPVRLMDLPLCQRMALERQEKAADESAPPEGARDTPPADQDEPPCENMQPEWRGDPIAVLAEAAGFEDHEGWWEEQIERRRDATDLFAAILEAMRSVREEFPENRPRELLREAHMRRTIRTVVRQGAERIAVVCGAWHASAVDEEAIRGKRAGCAVGQDEALLKGLPRLKTAATWIPWTYSRLTYYSGYGAGVASPGWYGHLWQCADRAAMRWVATAARLLREKDLDASSAGVIEAVRLADALAALRQLRSPGLAELNEAILSVLCRGEPAPMRLIRNRLEVGDVLGEVPPDTPSVPLAQDLARLQKSLRLKLSSEIRPLDLDLRNATDLARSHLLHRLDLLGVPWGRHQHSGGRASTFHEVWQLEWSPELAVAVIEAGIWGTTVENAATAKVVHEGEAAGELAQITALLDRAVLSGLAAAIDPLLARIQAQSAVAADVRHLMDALAPLARVARYGDVRGTQAAQVEPILVGMLARAMVGLGAACASLDDDAAERMVESVAGVQQALDILARDDLQLAWQDRLRVLVAGHLHPLLRGWCCRLLVDRGAMDEDGLHGAARLALSPANPPAECAAWATGLLRGSGLLLLHQDRLWQVFDRWLSEITPETFTDLLPLLRRAFCDFTSAERRQMGEKVKHLLDAGAGATVPPRRGAADRRDFDVQRARRALPLLARILGLDERPTGRSAAGQGDFDEQHLQ